MSILGMQNSGLISLENRSQLILERYNQLSLEEQEKFTRMAAITMEVQNQALDIMMKTLLKATEKVAKMNEKFDEIEERLNAIKTKPITEADLEESKRRVEKSKESLEKSKESLEKAKRETEEARLEKEKTIEKIKNSTVVGDFLQGLRAIGEHFKKKAFKGFYISGKDTSNLPPPSTENNSGDNRYTYLSKKSLVLGGAVVAGVFFFTGRLKLLKDGWFDSNKSNDNLLQADTQKLPSHSTVDIIANAQSQDIRSKL